MAPDFYAALGHETDAAYGHNTAVDCGPNALSIERFEIGWRLKFQPAFPRLRNNGLGQRVDKNGLVTGQQIFNYMAWPEFCSAEQSAAPASRARGCHVRRVHT